MEKEYQDLTAAEVKEFMRITPEDKYQLIDVRLEEEYTDEHLPGAILIPVGEIEEKIDEIDLDKDIVFYCFSGKRSVAASIFIGTHPDYKGKIYNMLGGILAWDKNTLPDMPNVKAFGVSGSKSELLYQAMNLEKGAHRFYEMVLEEFPNAPFTPVMEMLVNAEEVHARMIYNFWADTQEAPPTFEQVYTSLPGDILEGGLELDNLTEKLKMGDTQCQGVIEMAIAIEFSAYDLYRNMAHINKNSPMAEPFLVLCQSEKGHMRIAAEALSACH